MLQTLPVTTLWLIFKDIEDMTILQLALVNRYLSFVSRYAPVWKKRCYEIYKQIGFRHENINPLTDYWEYYIYQKHVEIAVDSLLTRLGNDSLT